MKTLQCTGKYLKIIENDILSESSFDKFVKVEFMNRSFMVIEDYDSWLKKIYGDYMQLPPLEKRITHHTLSELKL